MIEMICSFRTPLDRNSIAGLDAAAQLSEECTFCIKTGGAVFYEQPFFPILEFLAAYLTWNQTQDFVYRTLESAENPMLSFRRGPTGWKLDSVWKRFDCRTRFQKTDFISAAEALLNQCVNIRHT